MKRKLATVTALLLFSALWATESFAQLSFKTYRNFTSRGNASVCIIAADFNNDGILDLAAANTWANLGDNNQVSVMLGDGRGGFGPPKLFAAGNGAFFLTAADLNGDDNMDLVVANFGEPSISVLLGDGTGEFSAPRNFRVGHNPTGVVVADFNGDGIPDIASANFGFLPDPEEGEETDCSGSTNVALTISILIGEPAGDDVSFRPPINIETGCAPEGIYTGVFNKNGYQDLVVTHFYGDTIALLLGNEQGEFPEPPRIFTRTGMKGPAYGSVVDLDKDGNLDFVTANWFSDNVSVFWGNGEGGFETQNFPTQSKKPRSVVVGDFDNDSNLDIATSNYESNDISILFGNGSRNFPPPKIIPLEPGGTWFMTMGDFNRDGNLDFAVVRHDGLRTDNVSILTGDGKGNFGNFSRVASTPVSIATADFNQDGNVDLAIANMESDDVWVRLGDGLGGFDYEGPLRVGKSPIAIATGDFDNDRQADLATANSASNDVTVWFGNGQGRFLTRKDFNVNGSKPNFLLAVDLKRDGRTDLVTANLESNNVSVLIADNNRGFLTARTFPVGGVKPWSVNAGVFNRNGHVDLVTANSGSNDISILRGDGNGGFSDPIRIPVGQSPRSIAVEDFDGDGNLDLAVLNTGSSSVTVLFGDGAGGFSRRFPDLNLGGGKSGVYISQADLDGDNIADLVIADFNNNQVHILRGDGRERGRFLPPISYFAGLGPVSIAIEDYNGDGKKDLALVDKTSHSLAILINNSRP